MTLTYPDMASTKKAIAGYFAKNWPANSFHLTEFENGHIHIVTTEWELSEDVKQHLNSIIGVLIPPHVRFSFEARVRRE